MSSIEESSAAKEQRCLQLLQVDLSAWRRVEDGLILDPGLAWKTKTIVFLEPHVPGKQTSLNNPFGTRMIIGAMN